jgi:predicted O-methyltransferase YrrM
MGFFSRLSTFLGISKPVEPILPATEEIKKALDARVRHFLPSYLLSLDDEPHQPDTFLIEVSLKAIAHAWNDRLDNLSSRIAEPEKSFLTTFPGEHYRLLKAFTQILEPKLAVEIGTYRGLGCLSIKEGLSSDGRLVTYDILPWQEIPGTHLLASDWDNKMEFRQVDICHPVAAQQEWETLQQAELIFVDAAKDGQMERQFLELFRKIPFKKPPVIVFDDIRFPEMCLIWRDIDSPKLDLTSFGHWSGTGIVHWKPGTL